MKYRVFPHRDVSDPLLSIEISRELERKACVHTKLTIGRINHFH
jgi:hypothetical protein